MYHPASQGQRNVRLIVQHQHHYLNTVFLLIIIASQIHYGERKNTVKTANMPVMSFY
jgi:hypothetical protein